MRRNRGENGLDGFSWLQRNDSVTMGRGILTLADKAALDGLDCLVHKT